MKKPLKRILSAIAALAISLTFTLNAFAETYYTYGGYTYTIVDNNQIVIYGIDSDDYSEVSFPEKIDDRLIVVGIGLGYYSFKDDEKLTSVSFKEATFLKEIKSSAFEHCSNLASVTLGPSVQNIGILSFANNPSLTSFDWADSKVTVIKSQTFKNCTSLEYMELPEDLTEIGSHAFKGCTALKEIIIGKNVTSIHDTAFTGDDQLTIACFEDSYAHQFAQEHNIPVRILHEVKLGDADGDGSVNINDVTAIQAYKAEIYAFDELQLLAADVNYDGKADIEDATLIQSYLAEYAVDYPVNTMVTR